MLDVKRCVKNCMEKYGLSREEATRIATTDNEELTVQDLRYKYDNIRIGTNYPSWITPEEHLKICYSVVWSKYNTGFFWYNSCDDVAYDLFTYSSVHLHNYDNKLKLKSMLCCRLKNLTRDYMQEYSVSSIRCDFDDNMSEDENCNQSLLKLGAYTKDDKDMIELISTIETIKNEKIKGILILCGYFLADIREFLPLVIEYYNKCSERVREKIYDIAKDDVEFCLKINKECVIIDKKNVTVGRILKIFGYRDKEYLNTDLLPYMKNIGLVG